MLAAPVELPGLVDAAGVSLETGGVVCVPAAVEPAAAPDSPMAEPLLLALGLFDPELLHDVETMLTELTFRMFSAVPVIDPLVLLEAAPGALEPLPTVPETAT